MKIILTFVLLACSGCSLLVEPPECGGGTQLESGVCLRGDMQGEAAWVDDMVFSMGLFEPGLEVWLYSEGNMVGDSFEGELPKGTCVNGYYNHEHRHVVATPGTLPHELMHAYSDHLGELVPVYEIPNKELWELYELQHTPAFGWRDGYDEDIRRHYQVVGWTDKEWSVCDGW